MNCRMVDHLKRGTQLAMIEEDCDLRQLRGDIQHIGLFYTDAGPLIVQRWSFLRRFTVQTFQLST